MSLFNIVRFYYDSNKKSRVMQKGLSLEEAKEHCNNPNTRKEGVWFDGYSAA